MQILRTNLVLTSLLLAMVAHSLAIGSFDGYCDASMGDCGSVLGRNLLDDEMSRRMLVAALGTRYISYGALSRDRVPCSTAGRSYYNCQGSGPVNSYTRGCSRITHCYKDVK